MTYLVLAAVAWATATRGGTSLRDLLVVLGILLTAMVVGRVRPQRHMLLWSAFAVLLGWLLVDGPLRSHLTLETVRVPLLVILAAATLLIVGRMDTSGRETLVVGLIMVASLQAVIAIGQFIVSMRVPTSSRPDGLLGSPDGLGMLLVATAVLTARRLDRRAGRLSTIALLVQTGAILVTGSRAAILLGSILAIVLGAPRLGWRARILGAIAITGGASIVVWRTLTEPQDRLSLWAGAVRIIAAQPMTGAGSGAVIYGATIPGARPTTHAHDEVLQWGAEYGLIGVGIAVAVVVLALRARRASTHPDRWLRFAALAILAAGLTDFTLRITALAVAAAALVALATTESTDSTERPLRSGIPAERRDVDGLLRAGTLDGLVMRSERVPVIDISGRLVVVCARWGSDRVHLRTLRPQHVRAHRIVTRRPTSH